MNIGITQKIIIDKNGSRCDALEQTYFDCFTKLGANLIPLPNGLNDLQKFIGSAGIDRIVLSGGGDIDPALYGGTPMKGALYREDREALEKKILEHASEIDMPVFGICRGAQAINVFFGGKLVKLKGKISHAGTTHPIRIIDPAFQKICGASETEINSYHDFGFTSAELGPGLVPFAEAPDGVVEGLYHRDRKIYGVLWHPERAGAGKDKCGEQLIRMFLRS